MCVTLYLNAMMNGLPTRNAKIEVRSTGCGGNFMTYTERERQRDAPCLRCNLLYMSVLSHSTQSGGGWVGSHQKPSGWSIISYRNVSCIDSKRTPRNTPPDVTCDAERTN